MGRLRKCGLRRVNDTRPSATRRGAGGSRPPSARDIFRLMDTLRSSSLPFLVTTIVWGFASPPTAHAQSIPASAYQALRWRLIGPHRGGPVLAVARRPGGASTFYFGAAHGRVQRTNNAVD